MRMYIILRDLQFIGHFTYQVFPFFNLMSTPVIIIAHVPHLGSPHCVTHVKCPMNCKSRNIIYSLICAKCRSFYVGQTENLRQRVTLHRQQINHEEYSHLAVSEHIRRCSNGNFQIMPVYQCDSHSSRLIRESKERYIITILQPDLNSC